MTPPTTTLRKSTSTVMSSSGSLSDSATAAASSSPSSSLDFFHSNNSKMLSKALSTLSAAQPRSTTLLPSVSSSSSSSSSSIKLLNEAFEVSSRNTNYLDSIKKSFFSSANDKKKGELQKLMEDVLIEQRKEQLMEEMEEENTRFKRPQSPRREKTESANIITELLTPKTSTTPTIRVINSSSSSDSSNTNLIEQTKNETLRALISGPYSTKKIPLPPPPPQLPLTMLKATSGQLVAAGSCCSPAERRLNELKHEIIDLVSTNTASSFPVEENTSSPAANKKLVQELDEKEASMTKAMNKNMSFLESTLTRARGKKEIIENFLKLKSLLNTGSSSPTSESDSVGDSVRKLSMRSAAAGTTSGHKFVLDREQIRRIGAAKMDNSVKRLNLYSSIASKYFPKTSNKWDEENGTDQQEQEKHRHNHVEIVELDGEEEYIDENDDEEEEDEEDEDDIEMEDEQYMDDEEDEEDDDENDEEENNMIENENEEEEENELENILIRKRLTEPGIYVRGKGRGKYECPKCMWRARKLCVLKRHIMVSHANFKPFLCTYCKVAFKTKGNLVRHTKTKAHIRACSKLGMSPGDDEVTRISSKNIDSHQLNKQLKIDKRIKVS